MNDVNLAGPCDPALVIVGQLCELSVYNQEFIPTLTQSIHPKDVNELAFVL